MIEIKTKQVIGCGDLDNLVTDTYGKPYIFQQQDDCKDRGNHYIRVPDYADDFENDTVPEVINVAEMGVSFAAWLARDPKEWNGDPKEKHIVNMFWERNFYPSLQMVVNDLHAKGLFPAGEYVIEIDW